MSTSGAVKGSCLTSSEKMRIFRALWPHIFPATAAEAAKAAQPRRRVASETGFTRNKVSNVYHNVLKYFSTYYHYLALDNRPIPVAKGKWIDGDKQWRALINSLLEAQKTGTAFTDELLEAHITTLARLNAGDHAAIVPKRTLRRYKTKLQQQFGASLKQVKLYGKLRVNVQYDTCLGHILFLKDFYTKYPKVALEPIYKGNLDEQGSHCNLEHGTKPFVWLVPINEQGEYDPKGHLPRQYAHNSSCTERA